ncbi:NTP transferase domain-containing protein [Corallococcus sp. EGB]|uniref:nucleotidyltransferase family protein n=1 Tax=Corallococcus sp. EGB TaxID=1521117 RepID=UPI001CBEF278|nr:NTP transferase domain-containing protein [Corallococcus sp. EGB]
MKAVAIILAAGKPGRMSHPKALIEHEGGKSFLQSLASTFGKAGGGMSVLGVVGSDEVAVREQHPSLELVTSRDWEKSLMASVKAGLEAALADDPDVVLLHPVDMPAVRATTLKTLLKAVGESGTVLRPEFEGAPGWPLILTADMARKLHDAEGDKLEEAVRALSPRQLAVKDPGVVVNINTPEVYERLFGGPPKLAPPPKRRMKRANAANGAGAESAPASYAAAPSEE